MEEQIRVDMLAVCTSDGNMQPLRFRFEGEDQVLCYARVLEVLSCCEIKYVHVEAYSYLCRTLVAGQERVLNVRYSVRSHRWWLQNQPFACTDAVLPPKEVI